MTGGGGAQNAWMMDSMETIVKYGLTLLSVGIAYLAWRVSQRQAVMTETGQTMQRLQYELTHCETERQALRERLEIVEEDVMRLQHQLVEMMIQHRDDRNEWRRELPPPPAP